MPDSPKHTATILFELDPSTPDISPIQLRRLEVQVYEAVESLFFKVHDVKLSVETPRRRRRRRAV